MIGWMEALVTTGQKEELEMIDMLLIQVLMLSWKRRRLVRTRLNLLSLLFWVQMSKIYCS